VGVSGEAAGELTQFVEGAGVLRLTMAMGPAAKPGKILVANVIGLRPHARATIDWTIETAR